jgi:hypothetical protein
MPGCHGLLVGLALLTAGQTAPAAPPAPIAETFRLAVSPLAPPAPDPPPAPVMPLPSVEPSVVQEPLRQRFNWPEVWGVAQGRGYFAGTRMAPNGFDYYPLFDLDLQVNVGLLPNKKLYLFADSDFWGQRATPGQTHGVLDYTKREFDLTAGLAWTYAGPLELRFFGYAYNSLNRGISLLVPFGYNDGIGVEHRVYLGAGDPYDVSRLAFVSFGYIPSKALTGADGLVFKPGSFARAYLTHDLGVWNTYAYLDTQVICKNGFSPRLLLLDAGIAARPFAVLEGFELRVGGTDTLDVLVVRNRGLGYFAIRFLW